MRRFHVHLAVENLEQNVNFYSKMFGAPAVQQPDYAKWMIEDPPLNFAISTRGHDKGLNHLGIQVDSDTELRGMREQLKAADSGMVSEDAASCCYAKSDKYWITDPQGIAWETFHSLEAIPMFGTSRWDRSDVKQEGCCSPQPESDSACVGISGAAQDRGTVQDAQPAIQVTPRPVDPPAAPGLKHQPGMKPVSV
jgi:catechol 2,3-dioxygenase-like lactoylglutathione lyase family enzyme